LASRKCFANAGGSKEKKGEHQIAAVDDKRAKKKWSREKGEGALPDGRKVVKRRSRLKGNRSSIILGKIERTGGEKTRTRAQEKNQLKNLNRRAGVP